MCTRTSSDVTERTLHRQLFQSAVNGIHYCPQYLSSLSSLRTFNKTKTMAMSDFRRKKLIYVFKAFFDVDNSGVIDQEDFRLAAERTCRVHGWSVNEGRGAQVLQRLLDVWEALKRADSNSDGAVDQEEWCAMWENYANGGGGSQEWQEKYRDFFFSIMDTSGEGTIEEDEFTAVNLRGDVTASECAEAFKHMSKNNAVVVNSSVFAQLWKEFYTSDDPTSPGNFIYGKLKF